jgi:folate-binding protein YgfZ
MFWCHMPRDVVRVHGADAATYLQSQVSQDLRGLGVGDSVWSFVLQPTGKVDALARVWRTADDEFVLDTDAGAGEALVARLLRFRIRVKVEIERLDWSCIAVRPDRDGEVVGIDGLPSWGMGVDLVGPDVVGPSGAREGTPEELLAARIEAAWPAHGAEIETGSTLPAETGITAVAVSFSKGCYPGQELVERMDSRGAAAPRSLRVVDLDASGSVVGFDPDTAVVTSRCGTRALAYVRRSATSA